MIGKNPYTLLAACIAAVFGIAAIAHESFFLEDAYMSLRLAQNFAEGYGLVYNPGERYEMATNFLWPIILAVPFVIPMDPILYGRCASTLIAIAILFLAYAVMGKIRDKKAALITMGLIASNWTFFAMPNIGFAPHLGTMFALAAVYFALCYARKPSVKTSLAIGLSLALLSITRLDAQILFGTIICLAAWFVWKRGSNKISEGSLACGVPVAAFGVYLLGKYLYYGGILPASYYAKMGDNIPQEIYNFLERGLLYNWLFLRQYLFFIFMPLAAFVAWQKTRKKNIFKICKSPEFQTMAACLAIVVLWFLYMLKNGGGHIEFRFHATIIPFIFILLVAGMWFQKKIAMAAALIMILASLIHGNTYQLKYLGLAHPIFRDDHNTNIKLWAEVGQYMNELFSDFGMPYPKDLRIATHTGGAMPFYLRAYTFETGGLADPAVHQKGNHFINNNPAPGHQIIANIQYVIEKNTNIYLNPSNLFNKDWQSSLTKRDILKRIALDGYAIAYLPSDAQIIEFPINDQYRLLALYLIPTERIDDLFLSKGIKTYYLRDLR